MATLALQIDAAERAQAHYQHCGLCEHRCGADRTAGERGPCKAGPQVRLFRHRIEFGEEAQLVPSHLFYLSGCDLRCAFCIAEANAFEPGRGDVLDSASFNAKVRWGQARGATNLQWVGGEPNIHLPALLELMAQCDDLPPVVWKTDFYCTPEALDLLRSFVATYVVDFKFGNDACAQRIAGVDRYVETICRNLTLLGPEQDLIVRHLLMPGHFDCCFLPVMDWLRSHLPKAKLSIRDGYLPKWRARHFVELAGLLPPTAGEDARRAAVNAGLNLIY